MNTLSPINPALLQNPNISSALQNGAANSTKQADNIATEFEAVMLTNLVREMRKTGSEEGLFPGDKSDTMGGLFDIFISRQLADSGALGIRDLVQQWMDDRNGTATDTTAAAGENVSLTPQVAGTPS